MTNADESPDTFLTEHFPLYSIYSLIFDSIYSLPSTSTFSTYDPRHATLDLRPSSPRLVTPDLRPSNF